MNADTTALSIAFGNQGQKLPLVSVLALLPFFPFPLLALTDQVPLTSFMTTEKSTWDIQESQEGSQCLRWCLRRRFGLGTRGQRGYIRLLYGTTASAARLGLGVLWRRSVTTCLRPTDRLLFLRWPRNPLVLPPLELPHRPDSPAIIPIDAIEDRFRRLGYWR